MWLQATQSDPLRLQTAFANRRKSREHEAKAHFPWCVSVAFILPLLTVHVSCFWQQRSAGNFAVGIRRVSSISLERLHLPHSPPEQRGSCRKGQWSGQLLQVASSSLGWLPCLNWLLPKLCVFLFNWLSVVSYSLVSAIQLWATWSCCCDVEKDMGACGSFPILQMKKPRLSSAESPTAN